MGIYANTDSRTLKLTKLLHTFFEISSFNDIIELCPKCFDKIKVEKTVMETPSYVTIVIDRSYQEKAAVISIPDQI